jgi:hypothetical protein
VRLAPVEAPGRYTGASTDIGLQQPFQLFVDSAFVPTFRGTSRTFGVDTREAKGTSPPGLPGLSSTTFDVVIGH